MASKPATVEQILLTRMGMVFPPTCDSTRSEAHVRAVEIELADIGYAVSTRLRTRLAQCSPEALATTRHWLFNTLLEHVGGGHKHEPLFRKFPNDVPADTTALWWRKVLVHFLQTENQPCLFCRRTSTTHVLNPCEHVVCDHCFDGANYAACPVCEHHVDRSSPFFREAPTRATANEKVVFKLLDDGGDFAAAVKALFVSLCERKQALSAADRDALLAIVKEHGATVLRWVPSDIPVRENVAAIFGTLCQSADPLSALEYAKPFLKTATDVLRLVAVYSGTDGSLQPETVIKKFQRTDSPGRFWGRTRKLLDDKPLAGGGIFVPMQVNRFKVAKLRRPVRRALLSILESMHPEALIEDMLRHQSYWVWVGELLHPGEYAGRFPKVSRAFQIMRKWNPDGTRAPVHRNWYSKLEQSITSGTADAALAMLVERPGEFARRLDLLLRKRADDTDRARVTAAFLGRVNAFATPVLLTLRNHLPQRATPAPIRVYFPRTRIGKGPSSVDRRPLLPLHVTEPIVRAIDAELLRRFASKPGYADGIVDAELKLIIAPFNERSASRSAVALPRGSRVQVPSAKSVRLFLHWCQPQGQGCSTDLDLSIAFYDEHWRFAGTCSYYELQARNIAGDVMARSAGDLRNAPFPHGATEYIDLDREAALAGHIRYAVMVVNNYSGMPFSQLERGFAGLMLRDAPDQLHFDPRTVELKFALQGENGVFLPLVLDVRDNTIDWFDVHARGQYELNNVETSKGALTKLCPEMMSYFRSGVRASMFDVALLHSAARCQRVFIRGTTTDCFIRKPEESAHQFHARLLRDEPDQRDVSPPAANSTARTLAMLYRGDLDLPEGTNAYALFRGRVTPTLQASDFMS